MQLLQDLPVTDHRENSCKIIEAMGSITDTPDITLRRSILSIGIMKKKKYPGVCIDKTLREVVWQAVEQGRVTCGVQNCVHQLETEPCNLLLCVIPAVEPGSTDIPTSIHHRLIEAFCLEHSVQLIQVDSAGKLGQMLKGRSFSDYSKEPQFMDKPSDLSCVIVQYPNGAASEEDRALTEYCKSDISQLHQIALPD